MRLKNMGYCILMLVLVLTVTTGCEEPEPATIELVPQDANMLGSIQLSEILNDKDLIEAYEEIEKEPGEPQTFEETLDEIIEETGVDPRDFSEAIIFGNLSEFEQDEYIGFVLKGTFNQKQYINRLEDRGNREFVTSDYKGYKLYIDEEDEYGLAFLGNTILLVGSIEAVKDAIDVRKGDRKQISGAILDAYNQLGDVLIKFAFEFPEEARKAILEEPTPEDIPISFESFADIDILGFALNKEGDTISVYINSHFLSTDSAEDAYNTLSGAILLFKGMAPDPKIKELLSKLNVSVADDSVEIAFETTLSEIEKMSEEFR